MRRWPRRGMDCDAVLVPKVKGPADLEAVARSWVPAGLGDDGDAAAGA